MERFEMDGKMSDAEKVDRLQISAIGAIWGLARALGKEGTEKAAKDLGERFGQFYSSYPGKTSVEKLGNAYVTLNNVYNNEYEAKIGKEKSIIENRYCNIKLGVMPKVTPLVGEPVLGSMCGWCKILFPAGAAVNGCHLDIDLKEKGCKWTITKK